MKSVCMCVMLLPLLHAGDKDREAYCQPPIIPGHEFICQVVQLGEGVAEKTGLVIGDHCISEQIVPCWECRYCKRGAYHMCKFIIVL